MAKLTRLLDYCAENSVGLIVLAALTGAAAMVVSCLLDWSVSSKLDRWLGETVENRASIVQLYHKTARNAERVRLLERRKR